ncbi:M3 family metallopeptidase [Camelimonas abortus]|uniref:M3 family metallopeptidase n=1 Tax=Camelimonas abortus TaxID=1017184 RepID=A0ABV7LHH8_9HYPH
MTDAVPADARANPLLAPWTTPFGVPPFGAFTPADFREAFRVALEAHAAEIAAIAGADAPPTFDNVLVALERSGALLRRVSAVFFNLCSADATPELQELEREMAPALARHYNAIYLNGRLYARLAAVPADGLDPAAARLLERRLSGFRRAGAALPPGPRARLADIAARLAELGATFSQNVLADENAWRLQLGPDDPDGLPEDLLDAAAQAARERGLEGRVITLSRALLEPFLQYSARRDLRERAFRAFASRGGNGDAHDNGAVIAETLALRAERAKLLGYDSYAACRLDDSMARTPEAAAKLLDSVWRPARERALADQEALAQLAAADGINALEPWDWRHYAARLRQEQAAFDEQALKPWLQLDRMIEAAFHVAHRLFGLSFTPRPDLPRWRGEVRAWEVTDAGGRHVAVFYGDYFARPGKRGGAWMSSLRVQDALEGERPVVVNVMNFARPPEGRPALLSFDEARTLFHEFGHALHGMLSDVPYPSMAGTSVARDFVEFPSQLYEHWLEQPEVLQRFATHWRTGEPMPQEMLRRLLEGRNADQGFATVEYAASAIVDLRLHQLADVSGLDIDAFEAKTLEDIGMPRAIIMRHRPRHFLHVFAGEGYASAYYSYLWSEVLDADGFNAFRERGDIFDAELARRLRDYVYAAGDMRDPREAWLAFRGREADPRALLEKRGLAA